MGKTVLIINGHQAIRLGHGKLQSHLCSLTEEIAKGMGYEVLTTVLEEGYDIEQEGRKFVKADFVVFQTPSFWFNIPGLFKKYIDDCYAQGLFFANDGRDSQGNGVYSTGGLLKGKYLLNTTWNAPREAFTDINGASGGKSIDDIFLGFHITQKFVGLQRVEGFHFFDVFKNNTPGWVESQIEEFKICMTDRLRNL